VNKRYLLLTLLALMACAPAPTRTHSPVAVPETYRPCPAVRQLERPVWQGRDGWLFNEIDIIQRFEPGVPIDADLGRLVEAFRSQGVTLVAVVLPTRGSVYSDALGSFEDAFAAYDPVVARESYQTFLASLRGAGMVVPDLTPLVRRGAPFYLKRDQHWTSAGARRVAQRVAQALQDLSTYEGLETSTFRTRSLGHVNQTGWLEEKVETACNVLIPDESVEIFATERDTAGQTAAQALFGDEGPPPVTLVGTSNSNRMDDKPDSNFSGALREALELEVLNAAFPGGQTHLSLLAYLRSDDYHAHRPRLLVWESLVWDWHNSPRLVHEHRQVIPSIYGACSPDAALLHSQRDPEGALTLPLLRNTGRLPLRGSAYYLYLDMTDKQVVNFDLTLRYSSGNEETIRLYQSTWVTNTGRFFLELSSSVQGVLEDVTLTAYRPVQGEVHARICKAPAQ
jgi:hypothetical protein